MLLERTKKISFQKRVDCFKKIFKLSLKLLVLSLTDVEREGGDREREGDRDRGERRRQRERGNVRKGGRERLILALV